VGRRKKLSPDQVRDLVEKIDRRRQWTNKRLAHELGISETTLVNAYRRGKGWRSGRDANADAGN